MKVHVHKCVRGGCGWGMCPSHAKLKILCESKNVQNALLITVYNGSNSQGRGGGTTSSPPAPAPTKLNRGRVIVEQWQAKGQPLSEHYLVGER